MGKILLFYKYVDIPNPEDIKTWQKKLCRKLGLTGRVLIGTEGINGTLGGTAEGLNKYKQFMDNNPLFGNIDFKDGEGSAADFPKLRVAVRKEIVTLGIDPATLTTKNGGTHLSPDEAHKLMAENPNDLVILDTRNNFETRIGTFVNAIKTDTRYFREFPQYIDEHEELFKDKQILMACTGGIRCERASAYLNQKGIAKKVYQIEGGIHRYAEKHPDGFFRGKNYVFDGRIATRINEDILTTCDLCDTSCDDYTNCINSLCNKQYIACKTCLPAYNNTCGDRCKKLVAEHKVAVRAKPAKTDHTSSSTQC